MGGETEEMANVKGSAMASRLLWVRLNQGERGARRLAQRVSSHLAELLESGAVMSKWYPLDTFIELNEAIDSEFGSGDRSLILELGRHGAEANLTTIYRLFYKVGTVKWILARASRLWGMHYDSGHLVIETLPGTAAEARIIGFERPHRIHCLSVQGWASRSVELSGGKDVVLEELSCRADGDRDCHFRVTWR
jgi:hypothetical protein